MSKTLFFYAHFEEKGEKYIVLALFHRPSVQNDKEIYAIAQKSYEVLKAGL